MILISITFSLVSVELHLYRYLIPYDPYVTPELDSLDISSVRFLWAARFTNSTDCEHLVATVRYLSQLNNYVMVKSDSEIHD